jgi:predicted DNA-binding transcriptional regulator AlpA
MLVKHNPLEIKGLRICVLAITSQNAAVVATRKGARPMEDNYIPKPQLAIRYGKTGRTIERWVHDGKGPPGFPKPIKILGRDYFKSSEISEFEKSLKAK